MRYQMVVGVTKMCEKVGTQMCCDYWVRREGVVG